MKNDNKRNVTKEEFCMSTKHLYSYDKILSLITNQEEAN